MARLLRDKVILITGASSGIGKATALACAWAGMNVSLAARRPDKLQQVAKQVSDLNRKAHFFTCNVARPDDVRKLCDEVYNTFGRLDAVYANAGYGIHGGVMDTPLSAQRELFETNYFGTIHTLREAFPYMAQTEDGLKHMLICSSCLSEFAPPMKGVYSATKAAQDAVAQAMRAELAGEGFSVTSVHPVRTKTEFFDRAADLSGRKQRPAESRFEQSPEHVARKIVAALKHPKPEVWPMRTARFGAAVATAFPGLMAWALQRSHDKKQAPNATDPA